MYVPTDSDVKKARKELATGLIPLGKVTPARAARRRHAIMVVACAQGDQDAWMYENVLSPRLTMLPGELERRRFNEVSEFLDACYGIRTGESVA